MTFKQLEAIYWIARLGSFAEAAAKLHATQSTISKRVQELELQIGCALFDRSARSAKLTAKGEEMLAAARKLLEQRDEALARLGKPEVKQRRIRIGVTELTAMTWLPRFVDRMQETHPQVVIEPVVDMGFVLREMLVADEADIIFVPEDDSDTRYAAAPLDRVENAWMCKPGLVSEKQPLRLHELASYRLMTQSGKSGTGAQYARWLNALNVQPENTLVCNNLVALLGLTVSGLGISYLPRKCLRPLLEAGMLQAVKVTPALPPVKYTALCKKGRQSALFSTIIKLAQQACDFTLLFRFADAGPKSHAK